MNAGKWFGAIVGLQLAFLAGEAVLYQRGLATGAALILKVHPVDPRSLFTGHYMALGFDAEEINARRVPVAAGLKAGDTAYVNFRPGAPVARIVSVESEPSGAAGVVPVRATVRWRDAGRLNVDYGIERYYIPEARQEEANRLWWDGRAGSVTALVKVSRSGHPRIERIRVNGKSLPY